MNRYSYVVNNPLRYVDPTGHAWDDCSKFDSDVECKRHMQHVNKIKGRWAAEDAKLRRGSANDLANLWAALAAKRAAQAAFSQFQGIAAQYMAQSAAYSASTTFGGITGTSGAYNNNSSSDFFSDVAYFADNVGAIASDIEMIVVDTMAAIVITEGCVTGVGCGPALLYAAAIDLGVSWFSPLGVIENWAGVVALAATAISDINSGATYIHAGPVTGVYFRSYTFTVGIGRDTVVSAVNTVAGLVPEANFDAWISNKQLEYDNQRRSGQLPTVTQFEFTWMYSTWSGVP